jgi:2-polyprenyl-3-methyl-5-hydroxy-6-metoxy-1,4-benzoquinol methylase
MPATQPFGSLRARRYWFPDLSRRWTEPELMDDPSGDPVALARTLRHLKIINLVLSGAHSLLRRELLPRLERFHGCVPVVADIGAGGGDIALWLCRTCRRRGIPVRVVCVDTDVRAVVYMRERFGGAEGIRVVHGDAFKLEDSAGAVDFVFANHLLHHVEHERIPELLSSLAGTARHGMILSDLHRSPGAFLGFTLLGAVVLHGSFALADGRLSVCKALTEDELRSLASSAGLGGRARVFRRFPARLCLTWFRAP